MAGSLAAHGLVPRARLPMLLLLACYRAHAATLHRPVQLQLQPRLCASAVAVALTNASTAILHVCGYRPMHSNSKSGPAALAELPCALDARTAADVDMIAAWLLSAVGPRACARGGSA